MADETREVERDERLDEASEEESITDVVNRALGRPTSKDIVVERPAGPPGPTTVAELEAADELTPAQAAEEDREQIPAEAAGTTDEDADAEAVAESQAETVGVSGLSDDELKSVKAGAEKNAKRRERAARRREEAEEK